MTEWLELLRRQWNYALGQRLDWLTATRCPIDRCSLVSCLLPLPDIPPEPNYYSQAAAIKQLKEQVPAYRGISAGEGLESLAGARQHRQTVGPTSLPEGGGAQVLHLPARQLP